MKKSLVLFFLITVLINNGQVPQVDSLQSKLPSLQGKEKLDVLKTLTHTYLMKSYEKCIEYGLQTISLAQELNDPESEAFARRRTGYAYFQTGNFKESIVHYKRALQIFGELKDKLKVAIMADLLSNAYKETGEYDRSLHYFILGERTGFLMKNDTGYSAKNITRFFSILYTNGGLLYYQLDSNDKALQLFNQSVEFAVEINDSTRIAAAYSNMGMVFRAEEQYELSMKYYKKALQLARKIGNSRYETSVLMNIGNLFSSLQMPDSSLVYTRQSLSIAEQNDDKYNIAMSYHNIAHDYIPLKKYAEAIISLQKSLKISKEIGAKQQILSNYETLSQVWESLQNADSALYYFKQYAQLNDEITGEETSKKIAESQVKYETEKKVRENIILKQEARINSNIKQILVISVAALLLLSILLLFLFRLKSSTLKQRNLLFLKEKEINELAIKNKETEKDQLEDQLFAEQQINRLQREKLDQNYRQLSTVTLHIINKNEVLSQLLDEMEQQQNNPNISDLNSCFNKFSNLIDTSLKLDENWGQFKLHFEEVYAGFFENLANKYPELTSNEHKLCAYLKMKLSTKEIAQMLNITTGAVDKSRNRLRKKINIQPKVNLIDFIDEIA